MYGDQCTEGSLDDDTLVFHLDDDIHATSGHWQVCALWILSTSPFVLFRRRLLSPLSLTLSLHNGTFVRRLMDRHSFGVQVGFLSNVDWWANLTP